MGVSYVGSRSAAALAMSSNERWPATVAMGKIEGLDIFPFFHFKSDLWGRPGEVRLGAGQSFGGVDRFFRVFFNVRVGVGTVWSSCAPALWSCYGAGDNGTLVEVHLASASASCWYGRGGQVSFNSIKVYHFGLCLRSQTRILAPHQGRLHKGGT